jgi:hypothetical protein
MSILKFLQLVVVLVEFFFGEKYVKNMENHSSTAILYRFTQTDGGNIFWLKTMLNKLFTTVYHFGTCRY